MECCSEQLFLLFQKEFWMQSAYRDRLIPVFVASNSLQYWISQNEVLFSLIIKNTKGRSETMWWDCNNFHTENCMTLAQKYFPTRKSQDRTWVMVIPHFQMLEGIPRKPYVALGFSSLCLFWEAASTWRAQHNLQSCLKQRCRLVVEKLMVLPPATSAFLFENLQGSEFHLKLSCCLFQHALCFRVFKIANFLTCLLGFL